MLTKYVLWTTCC